MPEMGAEIVDLEKRKVRFRVFALAKKGVSVIVRSGRLEKEFPLFQESLNVYSREITGLAPDSLYKFRLDGEKTYPDPYSQYQPFGVHGWSQLVDHSSYRWHDADWKGRKLEELIIMEIHTGTFTPGGTFREAAEKIEYLVELGITAVEIMPVTQTPGRWNWGYDGVNLFSVNHNYGRPDDLKYFIDTCHAHHLSVILDVVYNHFGPEGNYLYAFGPYFTNKHQTPWGAAVNFDDDYSEFTRKMVLENVRFWLETYHFDGLRLDAVHAIVDNSRVHILQEISAAVHKLAARLKKNLFVIGESDENNVRLITPLEAGGCGLDAQWLDDFHHVVHTALTGEKKGYYMDYGRFTDFQKVFKNYLYTGEYSRYWQKNRGTDASDRPGKQFVAAIQNHDQVGNRVCGDRLSTLVDFPYLKAAAGMLFFSAYLPLLFMGEEYGETRPFLFFTDYQDPQLKKAVSRGRREEFRHFDWTDVPDPQDPESFYRSKLTGRDCWNEQNRYLFNYYRDLIRLRTSHPVLKSLDKKRLCVEVFPAKRVVSIKRWNDGTVLTALFNLGPEDTEFAVTEGKLIFNSEWGIYGGKAAEAGGVLLKGQVVVIESTP
ncbi:MAG: malto-oligosyltrehalose trehalohydrolase [Peptococcaceae bacterium]|jgi:maltooligosyltrehalose trehalohydrolase|nr:malto-oligosyltrehalose trehalohydrolase [Peptococcaceae bacterium]MDH7525222.1 malto-oligosyltrehalose trehalohydrolase [Peptococcaceae bacterium]